jgi:hypothetical protein
MPEMRGVVTIVQEGRFQLTDDAGVSHHFVLGSHALAETDQLAPLARTQARVNVKYKQALGIISFQADRIELLDR